MDFVSYETAVKLKEAGFPQPEPEQGQAWYVLFNSSEGPKPFIKFVIDDIRIAGPGPETAQWTSDLNSLSGVFAPTATDIMRALPGISLRWHSFHRVWQTRYKRNENRQAHENPAEACALVWLRLL